MHAVRLLALGMLTAAGCGESTGGRLDKSEEFAYTLPAGWTTLDMGSRHDIILLPSDDGRRRNVIINDQPGTSSFEELKAMYERDFAKGLRDFKLISSEITQLNGQTVVKMVHTNSMPGVPVRQLNYIVELGGKRYFIACTVMQTDGTKYDQACEEFVKSIGPP